MKLLTGIRGIVAGFRPAQGLKDLSGAGFRYLCLDLNLFCDTREIENVGKKIISNSPDAVREKITEHPKLMFTYPQKLMDAVASSEMSFEMALAPIHPYKDDKTDHSDLLFELTESAIKLCSRAGCKYLMVRPVAREQSEYDRVTAWYEKLVPAAEENDVKIVVSNQARYHEGHYIRGIFAEAEDLAGWLDMMNEKAGREVFVAALDVGNANLCGQDLLEMIRVYGERLKIVELRENNGQEEACMLPFTNTYSCPDYLGLIRGLREIDFDGIIWLNTLNSNRSFSPILKPEFMKLAKAVGDFFVWQIGMEQGLKRYPNRVLFGAGNMCRNYMKCYGEKYPPLFTCDNNSSLWDTEFCGLMIKNPEALKSIPEDCVIYICNTYYREISDQLRQMGVKNPIEYFNDEYLPSYYTDRIARKSDA